MRLRTRPPLLTYLLPLGKTFFLHCQRRHPELPTIPT